MKVVPQVWFSPGIVTSYSRIDTLVMKLELHPRDLIQAMIEAYLGIYFIPMFIIWLKENNSAYCPTAHPWLPSVCSKLESVKNKILWSVQRLTPKKILIMLLRALHQIRWTPLDISIIFILSSSKFHCIAPDVSNLWPWMIMWLQSWETNLRVDNTERTTGW